MTANRWRVTINGEVFERNARSPADAMLGAMRKYLAGPTKMIGGVLCRATSTMPTDGRAVLSVSTDDHGISTYYSPVPKNDVDGGAPLHRVYDDYAVFVERIGGDAAASMPTKRDAIVRRARARAQRAQNLTDRIADSMWDLTPPRLSLSPPGPSFSFHEIDPRTVHSHSFRFRKLQEVSETAFLAVQGFPDGPEIRERLADDIERRCRDHGIQVSVRCSTSPNGTVSVGFSWI